ncbi:MAG: hypothetical protein AB7P69_12180, partial [Candidatus Binatia bacterium]
VLFRSEGFNDSFDLFHNALLMSGSALFVQLAYQSIFEKMPQNFGFAEMWLSCLLRRAAENIHYCSNSGQ